MDANVISLEKTWNSSKCTMTVSRRVRILMSWVQWRNLGKSTGPQQFFLGPIRSFWRSQIQDMGPISMSFYVLDPSPTYMNLWHEATRPKTTSRLHWFPPKQRTTKYLDSRRPFSSTRDCYHHFQIVKKRPAMPLESVFGYHYLPLA